MNNNGRLKIGKQIICYPIVYDPENALDYDENSEYEYIDNNLVSYVRIMYPPPVKKNDMKNSCELKKEEIQTLPGLVSSLMNQERDVNEVDLKPSEDVRSTTSNSPAIGVSHDMSEDSDTNQNM